jgi:hypothetical protein
MSKEIVLAIFQKVRGTSFILESQFKEIERNLQLPLISSQKRLYSKQNFQNEEIEGKLF